MMSTQQALDTAVRELESTAAALKQWAAWQDPTGDHPMAASMNARAELLRAKAGEICKVADGFRRVTANPTAYPTGIKQINAGQCGMHAASPMSCTLCTYGHMLECHFPKTCADAQCGHYQREAQREVVHG